jgi:hypothetical protein
MFGIVAIQHTIASKLLMPSYSSAMKLAVVFSTTLWLCCISDAMCLQP